MPTSHNSGAHKCPETLAHRSDNEAPYATWPSAVPIALRHGAGGHTHALLFMLFMQ